MTEYPPESNTPERSPVDPAERAANDDVLNQEGAEAAILAALRMYGSLPGRQQLGLGHGRFDMFSSRDPALDFHGYE